LDGLLGTLTLEERMRSLLAAWRQGEEPNTKVVSTMPPAQAEDFDRLIDILVELERYTPWILLLRARLDELRLRTVLMLRIHQRAMELTVVGDYVQDHVREPITETEYKARIVALRAQMIPTVELAECVVEHRAATRGEGAAQKPWTAQLQACQHELETLVGDGTLIGVPEGASEGERALVQVGSFHDWLGVPMPVFSDACSDYEVVPDADAATVTLMQRKLQLVLEVVARVPRPSEPAFADPLLSELGEEDDRDPLESWGGALPLELRDGVQAAWADMRRFEVLADRIGNEDFAGEDPLMPDTRAWLVGCRQALEGLRADLTPVVGDFALPEPTDDDVTPLRRMLNRRATWRRRR
jgi:hypothetical protein